MPPRRKSYRPRRRKRPARRYKRKPAYKRNNFQTGRIKATIQPNVLYTNMKAASQFFSYVALAGSYIDEVWIGNSVAPFRNPGASYAAGDLLYNGMQQYTSMYNRATVLSCKLQLKIALDPFNNNANNPLQIILVPFPWNTTQNTLTEVRALSDAGLLQQKGAKSRVISGDGGKNVVYMTMARSTRKILGQSSITNDKLAYSCNLDKNQIALGMNDPGEMWFYYLRVVNNDVVSNQSVNIQSVLHANIRFSERTLTDQNTVQ